jgi:hypothetical protein
MDDSISPEDAAAWQEARRQYANYKIIQKVMKGAGEATAKGHISPLALRGALNGDDYAMGRADLEPVARVGQGLLRQPPDSGTAGRTQMNQVLTGGAWSAPASGIGAMIGGPAGMVAGAAAPFVLPRVAQEFMAQCGRAPMADRGASGRS